MQHTLPQSQLCWHCTPATETPAIQWLRLPTETVSSAAIISRSPLTWLSTSSHNATTYKCDEYFYTVADATCMAMSRLIITSIVCFVSCHNHCANGQMTFVPMATVPGTTGVTSQIAGVRSGVKTRNGAAGHGKMATGSIAVDGCPPTNRMLFPPTRWVAASFGTSGRLL